MRHRTYRDFSAEFSAHPDSQVMSLYLMNSWSQPRRSPFILITLLMALAVLLSACQPSEHYTHTEEPDHTSVLYLYNWSEYMPQQILDNFEMETGIKVISKTYETNEEMYHQIKYSRNDPPYDLIVPSNYFIDRMHIQGLLQPIDKTKISNFEQLNPVTVGTNVDPDNKYSIPYLWGTTGIAINSLAIDPDSVDSWQDLWRPEFAGRLVLPNDMREVFGMALVSLGYSANSENSAEIEQAYERLKLLLPGLSAFPSGSTRSAYITNKADIGMIWSGEMMLAKEEGKEGLVYKYPTEGAILWIDSFAIPKNAQHVEEAHRFINFVLRAENSQIISRELGYATPNLGARLFMSASTKANTTLYPTTKQFRNAHLQTAVSHKAFLVYEHYWSLLNQQRK